MSNLVGLAVQDSDKLKEFLCEQTVGNTAYAIPISLAANEREVLLRKSATAQPSGWAGVSTPSYQPPSRLRQLTTRSRTTVVGWTASAIGFIRWRGGADTLAE